jgi:hypothetical protein
MFLYTRELGQLSQYRDWATGWMTRVQFPAGKIMGMFFFLTMSSYPRCTRCSFPRDKVAEA